jgi:hypothetical protein
MTEEIKLNWKPWLYSLAAAAIGSASGSVGPMLVAPETFNVTSIKGAQHLLASFCLSGISAVLLFLAKSPLPPPEPSIVINNDNSHQTIVNPITTNTTVQDK